MEDYHSRPRARGRYISNAREMVTGIATDIETVGFFVCCCCLFVFFGVFCLFFIFFLIFFLFFMFLCLCDIKGDPANL